jgi:hypothetical protein
MKKKTKKVVVILHRDMEEITVEMPTPVMIIKK